MEHSFRILGSLEIVENGRLSPIMKSGKGCALLAYLIVTGQSQSREHVADLFWDTTTANALRNLRKVIYEVRQVVPELHITRKMLTFQADNDTFVDFHLLRSALQQADIQQLDEGLQQYRGELLATFYLDTAPRFNEWLILTRERLRAEVNHAYHRLCQAYSEQKLWLEGIGAAQRWLALDDLNETAHRWLIQFWAGDGQLTVAQQQYELCRTRLWQELQIEPEDATRRLMAQLNDLAGLESPITVSPELPVQQLAEEQLPEPGLLPPGSALPYQRHSDFTGRESNLQRLEKKLLSAAMNEVPVVAVTGVAGVGKTQLAVEFAYRYGRFFPGGVYWLSFAQADSVAEEIAATGSESGLHLFAANGKLTLADQASRVQQAWQQDIPRLLIFDNCEAVELLDKWRPVSGGCRILLTSQKSVWESDRQVFMHPLKTLTRTESITLLTCFVDEITSTEAERIAAELGDLPLALHLAGSFLQRYWTIDPERYLQQLAQIGLLQHPSLQGRGVSELPTGHDWHIARTFALNFEQLDPTDDVDKMAMLLLACVVTFAHGEPIPQQILLTAVAPDPDDLDAELLAMDGLIRLANLGIVTLNGRQTAQIHRLVALYTLAELGDDQLVAGQALAEAHILHLLDTQFQQSRFMGLLPLAATHLQTMTENGLQRADEQGAALALWWGRHLRDMGNLQMARDVLTTAVALQRTLSSDDDLLLADLLNILGTLVWEMGANNEAWPYYEEALQIRQRVLGEIHTLTARSLQNLAILHSRTGSFDKAKMYFEQTLSIYEQIDPLDEKSIALTTNNFGLLLERMNRLADAETQCRQALAIREKNYPPNHPNIAISLNSLGYLAVRRGDYETALSFHERTLQMRQAALGQVHVKTAGSLMNLGIVQGKLGDYATAKAYLEEALAIRQQFLPVDDPHIGQSLLYLGQHAIEVGDIAGAMALLTDGLAILQAKRPQDVETADTLVALAHCYLQQDELDKARDCLQQAEVIQDKRLVPFHLRTAYRWRVNGDLAQAQGNINLARQHYEQARNILEATAVASHPDLLAIQQKLADLATG